MYTPWKLALLALPFVAALSSNYQSRSTLSTLRSRDLVTNLVTDASDIVDQVNTELGNIIPIPINSSDLLQSTLDNLRQQGFEIDVLEDAFAGVLQAVVASYVPTSIPDALAQIATTVNGSDSTIENVAQLILNGLATTDLTQNVLAAYLSGVNSYNNVNPDPPTVIYPQKSPQDAPYTVPEAQLRAALYIPPGFTYGQTKRPVLFVPGTGAFGGVNFVSNLGKLLTNDGRFDPVYLNVPGAMYNDTQINSEYIAYAINYLGSITSNSPNANNLAVIPWSQGNLDTQWVFQYWPSTRPVVTDFISVSADFHGTVLAYLLDPALINIPLPPSIIQQEYDSNFVLTLRYGGGGSPYVNSTSVHSIADEIVQPQFSPYASADYFALDLPGTPVTAPVCPALQNIAYTNNEIQQICPGQPAGGPYTHEGVLYNSLMYALTLDALTHDGPGRVERLDLPTICAQAVAPGLTLADVLATEGLIPLALINLLLYPGKVTNKPAVMQYALQANAQCAVGNITTTTSMSTTSVAVSTTVSDATTTMEISTTSSPTSMISSTISPTTMITATSTESTSSSTSIADVSISTGLTSAAVSTIASLTTSVSATTSTSEIESASDMSRVDETTLTSGAVSMSEMSSTSTTSTDNFSVSSLPVTSLTTESTESRSSMTITADPTIRMTSVSGTDSTSEVLSTTEPSTANEESTLSSSASTSATTAEVDVTSPTSIITDSMIETSSASTMSSSDTISISSVSADTTSVDLASLSALTKSTDIISTSAIESVSTTSASAVVDPISFSSTIPLDTSSAAATRFSESPSISSVLSTDFVSSITTSVEIPSTSILSIPTSATIDEISSTSSTISTDPTSISDESTTGFAIVGTTSSSSVATTVSSDSTTSVSIGSVEIGPTPTGNTDVASIPTTKTLSTGSIITDLGNVSPTTTSTGNTDVQTSSPEVESSTLSDPTTTNSVSGPATTTTDSSTDSINSTVSTSSDGMLTTIRYTIIDTSSSPSSLSAPITASVTDADTNTTPTGIAILSTFSYPHLDPEDIESSFTSSITTATSTFDYLNSILTTATATHIYSAPYNNSTMISYDTDRSTSTPTTTVSDEEAVTVTSTMTRTVMTDCGCDRLMTRTPAVGGGSTSIDLNANGKGWHEWSG